MKNALLILLAIASQYSPSFGQCDIDFSTSNPTISFTGNIVDATVGGANATHSQSFDIWNNSGATLDCSTTGGGDDITFDFSIINTFDQYGVDGVIDAEAGTAHNIVQDGTGLKGANPLGTSGSTETSVGDVRGYSIKVTFADHILVYAQDLTVNMNSINTKGKAFESTSLVFFNKSGTNYGTATFNGFYGSGSSGASNTACTSPAPGTPWTTSGTGVFVAASTGTVEKTLDPCSPTGTGASNGPNDGKDVAAVADAGLANMDRVGGFIFTVYLEDVAATTLSGSPAKTTTNTSFTSTLNGITIAAALMPVSLVDFEAREAGGQVNLEWETESELNNDFFEIQRSSNGSQFQSIGKVNGNGTNNAKNYYGFSDRSPKQGKQYYRLKQVDFDGKFNYSKILSLTIGGETTIHIYPTQATDEITVAMPPLEENTSYRIVNSFGQSVLTGSLELFVQQQKINIAQMPAGIYFLQIENVANPNALKFFKQGF